MKFETKYRLKVLLQGAVTLFCGALILIMIFYAITEDPVQPVVEAIMTEDERIERMCATDPDPVWCMYYQKKLREDPEYGKVPYYVRPDGYEEK